VDLLQKVIMNFKKVKERRGALDDGPEVLEALVEATKDIEDKDPVIDGRPRSARASAMPLNLQQYSVTERSTCTKLRKATSR
jgi:hypothetical protein